MMEKVSAGTGHWEEYRCLCNPSVDAGVVRCPGLDSQEYTGGGRKIFKSHLLDRLITKAKYIRNRPDLRHSHDKL